MGHLALRRPLSAGYRDPGCHGLCLAWATLARAARAGRVDGRAFSSTWMQASSRFLRRMFLTFFARMLPALSVAKPACIRKTSAPARRGRNVRQHHMPFRWCESGGRENGDDSRTGPHEVEGVELRLEHGDIISQRGDCSSQLGESLRGH